VRNRITSQDGDVTFSFRSDRLCLDFAATLMFRSTATPKDLLGTTADVVAWARAAGLVADLTPFPAAQMAEVRRLREDLYSLGCALAAAAPLPPEAITELNNAARQAPPTIQLAIEHDTEPTKRAYGDLAAILSALARDGIDLATGPDAHRVRQCHRDGCTRLFLDRSRAGNRIWCGMQQCGNRINAAAYRRRRSQASAATGEQSHPVTRGNAAARWLRGSDDRPPVGYLDEDPRHPSSGSTRGGVPVR
jgi:predicted RNA-binding Zn ribbon-like protein